jgi:hypothetical protein
MSIGALLTRVPWTKVITMLPPIVRTARELLARNKPEEVVYPEVYNSTEELEERIRQLEDNERQQAALIEKIAIQLQNFADSIQILDNRMRAVLWLALLSILFSLASLIYVIVR